MRLRRFVHSDAGQLWALNNLPNVGDTADRTVPLDPPIPPEPPPAFPYLADVERHFLNAGGEFLVVEHDTHLVGMGGLRPNSASEAEVLHIRVHPAARRLGVGRMLMDGLEARTRDLGFRQLHLDTATNQPDAVAFYRGLDYTPAGIEAKPGWTWTLQYFTKTR
ncbi:MAG: GNAT family N-acetyltransferase [Acidimicrobiales bacterium]